MTFRVDDWPYYDPGGPRTHDANERLHDNSKKRKVHRHCELMFMGWAKRWETVG